MLKKKDQRMLDYSSKNRRAEDPSVPEQENPKKRVEQEKGLLYSSEIRKR